MSEFAVSINNLTKYYKDTKGSIIRAIDSLDLDIPRGMCCALLGSNGAGKSTLINIIGGSINKTSGSVRVLGYDLDTQLDFIKYKIGIVPQDLLMDMYFPLHDALDVYAGLYGVKPKERKTREILQTLDLYDKSSFAPRQLSGGMKRRFLIAKALVNSPEILILDEPTAGVDVILRDRIWEYIKYLKSIGKTIILITHYFQEAQELCDYFAFMKEGKIIFQGMGEKIIHDTTFIKKIEVKFVIPIEKIPNNFGDYECDLSLDGLLMTIYYSKSLEISKILGNLSSLNMQIVSVNTRNVDLEMIFKRLSL